ncbi:MAG: sigma 54-interacting transcriptional regulator [Candidatus Zixiibacteriota bacterium]
MNNDFFAITPSPVLEKYSPLQYLSENPLAHSWVVTNNETNRRCFIKVINTKSELDSTIKKSTLLTSYRLQQRIKSPSVVTAHNRISSKDIIIIEYPYIDQSIWRPLTEKLFWDFYPKSFVNICHITDYIHLLGLIHGDLKLSNFLLNLETGELRLADLDFMKESGAPLKAIIMGAPEHIAPEIFLNLPATPLSDNYAIGTLLKHCLIHAPQEHAENGLDGIASRLTEDDPYQRPYILLDALHSAGLLSDQEFAADNGRLLKQQIISRMLGKLTFFNNPQDTLREFLIDENHLLGIPVELIDDLAVFAEHNKRAVFDLLSRLITTAPITRIVDYWHIDLTDDDLVAIYAEILKDEFAGSAKGNTNAIFEKVVQTAERCDSQKQFLKAYLLLYRTYKDGISPDLDAEFLMRFYSKLARLAVSQNNIDLGIDCAVRLAEYYALGSDEYFEQIRFIILQYLSVGKHDEVREFIKKGLMHCMENSHWYLDLNRLLVWVDEMDHQRENSLRKLQRLYEIAELNNDHELRIRISSDIGAYYWRRGNYRMAREKYLQAVGIGIEFDLMDVAASAQRNLAYLYTGLAKYKKAIKLLKDIKRHDTGTSDFSYAQGIFGTIALAYSRMNDHKRAKYWMNELHAIQINTPLSLIRYHYGNGNVELNYGHFNAAEKDFNLTIQLLQGKEYGLYLGKSHHCLMEIAIYRGEIDKCELYCNLAKKIFRDNNDETSLREIELMELISDLIYGKSWDNAAILDLINNLHNSGSIYTSMWGVFLISLFFDGNVYEHLNNEIVAQINKYNKSDVPLFRALYLQKKLIDDNPDDGDRANILKEMYRIFHTSGHHMHAVLVCEKLIEIYRRNNQIRLAIKYTMQGLSISRKIPNSPLALRLRQQLDTLNESSNVLEGRIDSLYKVADVLNNVTDYESALSNILQFAVNEAGAERGALLLYSGESNTLHIKSFMNCDNQSLSDISELSQNIPRMAALSSDPLIISNALEDNRTKNFKSVIMHNIQSVLCVPITYNKKVLGVLYLDHYTIPALFSEDDISFTTALSNFIGLLITLAQRFNVIQVTNNQLLNDLSSAGVTSQFITNDTDMLTLFKKLPDIACTNANVLVTGESGTGKEILCEMIHNMSLRSDRQLVKINCAALPKDIIEAELFGIEKGVATGVKRRIGKFAAADSGTLFLDEIGDMPLSLQTKLLRVIEYQKFEMVGSHRTISTDIRFIYATNKNLSRLIDEGKFISDLYFRINTITIEISPLRKRLDDIPLLINHFARAYLPPGETLTFTEKAMEAILSYSWPGNARELKNTIERICILHKSQPIDVANLPHDILNNQSNQVSAKALSTEIEKSRILNALIKHDWNQSRAARSLDIPLSTFRRKIKLYKIERF